MIHVNHCTAIKQLEGYLQSGNFLKRQPSPRTLAKWEDEPPDPAKYKTPEEIYGEFSGQIPLPTIANLLAKYIRSNELYLTNQPTREHFDD